MKEFKLIDETGAVQAELKLYPAFYSGTTLQSTPKKPASLPPVSWTPEGKPQLFDLDEVWPCGSNAGTLVGELSAQYFDWMMRLHEKDELKMKGLTKEWLMKVMSIHKALIDNGEDFTQKKTIREAFAIFNGKIISAESANI